MQSFSSVKSQLEEVLSFTIEMKMFRQINFIARDWFRFYRDPLKNMVIGMPASFGLLAMRKYGLRKSFYEFALVRGGTQESIEEADGDVPEGDCEVGRTALFFSAGVKKAATKKDKVSE